MPWFSSWAGVVSLILSVLALAGVLVGYGRWLEKLNGMGKRVGVLEGESATAKAERAAFQTQITRTLDNQTRLIEQMGEHKRTTEACREDTEQLGIKLGSELHELNHTISAMDKSLSVRLAQVETILKERNIGQ